MKMAIIKSLTRKGVRLLRIPAITQKTYKQIIMVVLRDNHYFALMEY